MAAPGAEEVEMNVVMTDRLLAAAFQEEAGLDRPRAALPADLPEAAAEMAIVAKRCRRRTSAMSAIR